MLIGGESDSLWNRRRIFQGENPCDEWGSASQLSVTVFSLARLALSGTGLLRTSCRRSGPVFSRDGIHRTLLPTTYTSWTSLAYRLLSANSRHITSRPIATAAAYVRLMPSLSAQPMITSSQNKLLRSSSRQWQINFINLFSFFA